VRRGISPVIATVILIAVTLAIGIAVAAWLMGVWGGLGGGEQLRIYPESTLTVKDNETTLKLVVKNEGSRDVVIRSVTVAGYPCDIANNQNKTIGVGAEKILKCNVVDAQLTAGASYEVKVYTEGGSVFTITLIARQAQGQGGT